MLILALVIAGIIIVAKAGFFFGERQTTDQPPRDLMAELPPTDERPTIEFWQTDLASGQDIAARVDGPDVYHVRSIELVDTGNGRRYLYSGLGFLSNDHLIICESDNCVYDCVSEPFAISLGEFLPVDLNLGHQLITCADGQPQTQSVPSGSYQLELTFGRAIGSADHQTPGITSPVFNVK